MNEIAVALIGALPATIAAVAAWRKAAALSKPLQEAVKEDRELIETVTCLSETTKTVAQTVARVEQQLRQHQAWHQEQTERASV